MSTKRVLITGINGSIGKSLATYLNSNGYEVHGTTRKLSERVQISYDTGMLIELDLSKDESFSIPDNYFDVIIHCAAATSESTLDSNVSKKVNVLGTEKLIKACIESNIQRFIYISSMSANPDNPSSYAQTKLEAERRIMMYTDIEWVILRPGLVINYNGRGIFNKMLSYIKTMPIIPIIGNNNNLSTISIDDLCKAVFLSCEMPNAIGKVIDVSADESLRLIDFVKAISKKLGKKAIYIYVPYSFALIAASVSNFFNKPIITKDNVYGLKYARKPDATSLQTILGMRANTFKETVEEMVL